MYDALVEAVAEVGSTGVRAVGAVLAAFAGVFVELNGIQTFATNHVVGAWMAFVGCLLLVICYVLATETVRRFRSPTG